MGANRKGKAMAVVGACGFIGRRSIEALARAAGPTRVLAIDARAPEGPLPPNAELVRLDLTRPGADGHLAAAFQAAGVEAVLHAAFLGRPVQNRMFAHELEAIGTLHVLNACAAAKVRKLVVTSTTGVYGAGPRNPNWLREDAPLCEPRDRSEFVADKVEAEHQVADFAAAHPAVVVTVLRMASVVGPTVRNAATAYLRGRVAPTVLGFDPLLQVLHEDDAVESVLLALSRDVAGPLNVAAPGLLPLSLVLRLAGTPALPLPYPVARFALDALFAMGLLPVRGDLVDFLRFLWVADTSRAEQLLGFRAMHGAREAVLSLRRGGLPTPVAHEVPA